MICGYASISIENEIEKSNSLNEQVLQLLNNGCSKVVEEELTATTIKSRPRFNKLLAELEPGDTLMITRLDNISRILSEGSKLINKLIDKNVKVNILNIGIIDKDIFSAFAEFEYSITKDQKKEMKVSVTRKSKKRKRYTKEILKYALSLLTVNGGTKGYDQVELETGISRSTLFREQKKKREMEMNQLKND